jgi:hypothetical protein
MISVGQEKGPAMRPFVSALVERRDGLRRSAGSRDTLDFTTDPGEDNDIIAAPACTAV